MWRTVRTVLSPPLATATRTQRLAALVTVAACVVAPGIAAAEGLTVLQALEIARQRNPELLAARQEAEIARSRLAKARHLNPFNPEIEGGAAQRRFDAGGTATQATAGVSLEIEVAGQRGKRIAEAERGLARVEAEIANVERLLLSQVTTAFYRTLYQERRLQLFHQVENLSRRLRQAAAERFRSGAVPKLEDNLAAIRYSHARKDTLGADRDHRNAVREVERLLGREPSGTLELSGDLAVRFNDSEADTLVRTALRLRPDLRAREAEIQRLDAETALTHRSRVPNPTLRATYDEEAESHGSRDRIVGGAISIPLPLFDRRQAELAALAGQRAQATHSRSATVLTVQAEVRDAYRAYTAAEQAVRVFESEAVEPIAESFRLIETAYREGKIDLVQLVVVQNDLVAAQFSYLDSLWEYWQARAALECAVARPLEESHTP